MKIMFTSDVHSSAYRCGRILDIYEGTGAERLVLLGDILYHDPRNGLLRGYAPKEVIAMLDPMKNKTYAARGNCDTEVDQIVLDFLITADYGLFVIGGRTFYATHGHVFDQGHLLPMKEGDILVHGHTHLLKAGTVDNTSCRRVTVLNLGPASIPKGGNPHTYAVPVDGVFRIPILDRNLVEEMKL